jgi:hypothetical protein
MSFSLRSSKKRGNAAMAINVKDIKVGACYVTASGQVRHVIKVADNKVLYEARGKKAIPRGKRWGSGGNPKLTRFAAAVGREVPCDYDPTYEKK